jgi:anti-anti-sigma factor
MEIHTSTHTGRVPVTVFQLVGDLDMESHEELQQQAAEAFQAGSRYMLLDLSKVKFMSSAGLRAIYQIFGMLRAVSPGESEGEIRSEIAAGTYHSPNLKLLKPSARVLQVLTSAGFDMFLEIHSDLRTALASFG